MVNTGAHAFVIDGAADREERLAKSDSCLRRGGDEPWQKHKKDSPEPPKAVLINPPG
jgi:hypothetical protein